MTSEKQIASNRRNSKKSTGPDNTSSSKLNAVRHGLLSKGLTQMDDCETYHAVLAELERAKSPVGSIEKFLVQTIALDMVKLPRAQRCEAEYLTGVLNQPTYEDDLANDLRTLFPQRRMLDPGIPATLTTEVIQHLVHTYDRYQTSIVNRFVRNLHELERLQRMRGGVVLHAETEISNPAGQEHTTAPPADWEDLPSPIPTNIIQAVHKPVAAASTESRDERPEPTDRDDFAVAATVSEAKPMNKGSSPDALWQKPRPRSIWSP
jgi:hypothetical protein